MSNITDIRDHQPMASNDPVPCGAPYSWDRVDSANQDGAGWSISVPPVDRWTTGQRVQPSTRAYRMAYTIMNLRLVTVFERARWVAKNPDWREYVEAFRAVCEYEAGEWDGGEAA